MRALHLAICPVVTLLWAMGCVPHGTARIAPAGVTRGGDSRAYLEDRARGALVHVDVWTTGSNTPAPGTAFVVAQLGRSAYLLTALHVVQSQDSEVTQVRLTGASDGCIAQIDTAQPEQLIVERNNIQDIALLKVDTNGSECTLVPREALEKQISEALVGPSAKPRPFVLLTGGAGTGKSVLAAKVALDMLRKYLPTRGVNIFISTS